MKKIGLVLSGGAAYGFAHIGVLEVLEKNRIKPEIIAGTSMGAIVGGMYAAGIPVKTMVEAISSFTQNKFVDVNLFGLVSGGLVFGNKIMKFFKKHVGDKKIEECDTTFACVTAELSKGKEVVLKSGSLSEAMRASMSVPGLFRPVKKDKMVLVDGGVCNNFPIKLAREMGADIVIGVDVTSFYKKEANLKSAIEVLISAMNFAQSEYMKKLKDKGDVHILVEQPNTKFTKLTHQNAITSIKYGRKAARKMLPEIKALLEKNGINTYKK